MSPTLSMEQVDALAPDADTAEAALAVSSSWQWLLLQHSGALYWGELQGSGTHRYNVAVDLRHSDDPRMMCSCADRKPPCKHALALAYLLANSNPTFDDADVPSWLRRSVQNRAASGERQKKSARQRKQSREKKVSSGIEDLALRLSDVMRHGLAYQAEQAMSYWDEAAARLVDAQAPGLARMVRRCAELVHGGDGWEQALLQQIAKIHLLLESWRKLSRLSAQRQADIKALIGFALNKKQLLQQDGILDEWWVVARHQSMEENLRMQRIWLRGYDDNRWACIIEYAAHNSAFPTQLEPGSYLEAELVFYPGTLRQRAVVKHLHAISRQGSPRSCFQSVEHAIAEYQKDLAAYPWLENYPLALRQSRVFHQDGQLWLFDDRHQLPIRNGFAEYWRLLALSAGAPIDVFAEYDGHSVRPLSVINAQGMHVLSRSTGLH